MPDRENWTAAMVLKWVLTRDQAAVLAMADTYGAVGVFEDGTVSRLAPEDIDAVVIAYCIDPTLPPGEEKDALAVVRSQRAIAAKDEIYRALRRGELEARTRRNGAGDVETIAPSQWLSLKFKSWNGHDLAVPINVEQDVLNLPRAFEDYIGGKVPAEMSPAVWPDPVFAAEHVKKMWSADERNREPADSQPRLVPDRSGEQANRPTSGAQTKCESWLRKIGTDELAKQPKPHWRSIARTEFRGLSNRGFDRAWSNVAEEFPKTISKAGRKPKKSNRRTNNYRTEF
jgi:hypothetical protein